MECSACSRVRDRAQHNVTDEDEIRYGKSIADIAVEAGVRHLVDKSINVAGPEKTGMGHFDSKSEIEAYMQTASRDHVAVEWKIHSSRLFNFCHRLFRLGIGGDQPHPVLATENGPQPA